MGKACNHGEGTPGLLLLLLLSVNTHQPSGQSVTVGESSNLDYNSETKGASLARPKYTPPTAPPGVMTVVRNPTFPTTWRPRGPSAGGVQIRGPSAACVQIRGPPPGIMPQNRPIIKDHSASSGLIIEEVGQKFLTIQIFKDAAAGIFQRNHLRRRIEKE